MQPPETPRLWRILTVQRVTEEATKHGYLEAPGEWANLGQGAPEVDHIEGCFERPDSIPISSAGREYGPTAGIKSLRAAVANLYNHDYRQGKESQYTWENVCIVPGGRAGLIRIAAVLGNAYLGFFIPDYTAYNEVHHNGAWTFTSTDRGGTDAELVSKLCGHSITLVCC